MRHYHFTSLSVTFLLLIAASACGSIPPTNPTASAPAAQAPTVTQAPKVETTSPDESAADPEFALEDIETATFDNPTDINNKWFPIIPGTEYVYDGFTEEGGKKIPHRIIFTVTDLTKEVAGVRTAVVYILDYSDDALVEAEIAFYAQDNDGNVWFMGEYPEVYELGEIVEAPAWIPGLKGAKAGIVMKADPQLGMPSYAQGWGPAVGWSDRGRVIALGEQTCVPVACYEDVLITEEFSQTEPDAFQVKHYAPGVGNIKVTWRGADASRETLDLLTLTQLSPQGMAKVREAALDLEESAFENSKEVYAATSPLEYTLDPAMVAEFKEFDPGNFSDPTIINNMWMPMVPGTRWVHEGTAVDDEGNSLTRRIEFTVTDLTKEIAGVRTVVAWIVDYNDDEVVEKEIAFYAQDKDGNVWYLGEYPEEYEAGEFVKASPWIHGIEDARAGIKMMADPALEIPGYFQGWGPEVDWSDYGQIDEVGQETCVPVDCYEDVLVIAESSLGEVDAYQLKYYARGVGEVRVGWKGEDATREELELIEVVHLSPEQLAEVREMALELEKHAVEVSNNVYGKTLPLE
ncbi:MAG TPA: hypothetical protein VJ785_08225 [Anaerolineales bacterium]|nr:hypothetical protein [Anaerolineales bacterium]